MPVVGPGARVGAVPDHLLLVDDNPRYAGSAARVLRAGGFTVTVATDPVEALEAVEVQRPDVVLVDISLGADSGVTLCRSLRAAHPFLADRVLLMSTRPADDVVELVEAAGAAGFVDKSTVTAEAVRAALTA
jgi:CheY-like chemotaxis protein